MSKLDECVQVIYHVCTHLTDAVSFRDFPFILFIIVGFEAHDYVPKNCKCTAVQRLVFKCLVHLNYTFPVILWKMGAHIVLKYDIMTVLPYFEVSIASLFIFIFIKLSHWYHKGSDWSIYV